MHIQKGKLRFSRRELWNLDYHLSGVIVGALKQFRDMDRSGVPTAYVNAAGGDVEKGNDLYNEDLDFIIKWLSEDSEPEYEGGWTNGTESDGGWSEQSLASGNFVFPKPADKEAWEKYMKDNDEYHQNRERAAKLFGELLLGLWD